MIQTLKKMRQSWRRFLQDPSVLDTVPKTPQEIERFIRKVPFVWYQEVLLPYQLKTPGRDSRKKFEFAGLDQAVRGKTVLDLGCNVGALCFLAEESGASQVTGIDLDGTLIRAARVLNAIRQNHVEFKPGDARKALSHFGPKSFDFVFAFAMLHKMTRCENQWAILTEAAYAEDLKLQEHMLSTAAQIAREAVYLELTYRVSHYVRAKENYPAASEVNPALFVERYTRPNYFKKIEMIGDLQKKDQPAPGGKMRVIYRCLPH
ncbi:MAG: class I SAM-dependent methyltransferase [Candidatus Omnitrophica bacterium]|nr:class I SAM-dependent methyltransferase [Candidatus Omnitrophota bacterium]